MIKHDQVTNYHGASSIIAHFKNNIIDQIWGVLGVELRDKLSKSESQYDNEKFYKINRGIGDIVDSFVRVYQCEYRLNKIHMKMSKDEIEGYVRHMFANQIADAILKDESTVIKNYFDYYTPEDIYSVSVPFLHIQTEMIKNPKDPANE